MHNTDYWTLVLMFSYLKTKEQHCIQNNGSNR